MKKYHNILALLCLLFVSLSAQSSSDSTAIKLELKDGSTLFGNVIGEDSLSLQFKTLSGISVSIPHYQIRWKTPYSQKNIAKDLSAQTVPPKYFDPNSTRLYLAPTARPIGSGRGYFSACEIFFPTIALGITDYVSLAGGMSLFPGSSSQLLYFSPKVTFLNTEKFSFSAGGLWLGTTEGQFAESGLYYGVMTFGNSNFAATLGIGSSTQTFDAGLFIVGAEFRISNFTKLITENWLLSGGGLSSFGIRFFNDKLAADLGFIRSISSGRSSEGFPFIPWLGFVYNFGPEQKSYGEESAELFIPTDYRITASYDLSVSRGLSQYKTIFEQNGFRQDYYDGFLFGSGNDGIKEGSGITIQLDRIIRPHISAGITISTLGSLAGKKSSIEATQYGYPENNYTSSYVHHEHSIETYAVHAYYTIGNDELKSYSPIVQLGIGAGVSFIYSEWRGGGQQYYYNSNAPLIYTSKATKPTGVFLMLIEQRFTQYFSLGLHGSYFFMPETKVNQITIFSGTYIDYSTSPNQEKTTTSTIAAHSVNFNYGKIGLAAGIHF
jgi:hypothetical protein